MYGEGLRTTVLPARSAGAIFQDDSSSGKFQGAMAATTPIGRRTTSTKAASSSCRISRSTWRSA